ncbi:hypothetical protein MPSEU_000445900 [Mayamaea pseudoterrestris]|nr:hypothetical protein MPSEU_000445900 [Mayamaea pseudoterrestris]
MAALTLPTRATYEVHEHVKVDTTDNEDHTFCGILFPIRCKNLLPIEHIIIKSVAVRGDLGLLSVYVSNERHHDERQRANNNNNNNEHTFRLTPRHWTKIYERSHESSSREYQVLTFDVPVMLKPGQVRALYVHSQAQGDSGIVYDNSNHQVGHHVPRHDDNMLTIYSGKAHLSPVPFGQNPIWGWGNAWRDHREFVGTLEYATRYKLWTPHVHDLQGPTFRNAVTAMISCQRRFESPVSLLPDECLYYIMNMCRWDWFGDAPTGMRVRRRLRRDRELEAERVRRELEEAEAAGAAVSMEQEHDGGVAAASPASNAANDAIDIENGCCRRRASSASSSDESFHDAEEAEQDVDSDLEVDSDVFLDEEMDVDDDDEEDDDEDEDDDDDDDEEAEEVDDDDDDDSATSDESDWERAHGYRADNRVLRVRAADSDDEGNDEAVAAAETEANTRQAWFHRNLHRIHVLRAMVGDVAEDGDADMDA